MRSREEYFVSSQGVRLFAVVDGEGPPVVVLHGFTGSLECVSGIAEALADRYSVVRIDLVGHGRSDAPDDVARFTMACCVAQVAEVIEELAGGSAHLIGYSMGGRVALSLAATHPDCVESLVLVGATPGIADACARRERVAADEALAQRILDEGIEAFVDHWMALPLFASQQRLGEAALAGARARRLCNRPEALASSLRGMGTGAMPTLHAALPQIAQPACLVVGDEDEKFARVAAEMARLMPRARRVRLPRSGHAAHLENPKAFAHVTRAFLSGVEAAESIHP
jgi:2-succinyl-6-hydroxy-2,4-cyclohexadiene-1-carboxylate synthase